MRLSDYAAYYGKTENTDFYGKKAKNAMYIPVHAGRAFDPTTFDMMQELDILKQYIGTEHFITPQSRTKKRIVGIGKNVLPVGFGGMLCFEVCYVK